MAENPSVAQAAPRQVVRGAQTSFDEVWLEPDGTPIPMLDAAAYPAYQVYAPDGTTLTTGTAMHLGDGRYRASVFLPADAQLTSPDQQWRVNWVVVTPTNRVLERSYGFQVVDNVEGDPTERAYTYLTMLTKTERLIARFFTEQDFVSVEIRDTFGCVVEGPFTAGPGSALQMVRERGTVAYYLDTTPADQAGLYQVVWTSRQTAVSPQVTTVQALRVAEQTFWGFAPSLRMLIDKVQKRSGLVYAYSDSDLYEYMVRGWGMVNGMPPIATQWSMGGYPMNMGFEEFALLAAGFWGLQAQYLAEGESMFNFSGASTTLDVDRTGVYDAAMSRMRDYLTENLPKAKTNWIRSQSTGVTTVRPYNFSLSNTVFRVDTGFGSVSGSAFMNLMSNIGLF